MQGYDSRSERFDSSEGSLGDFLARGIGRRRVQGRSSDPLDAFAPGAPGRDEPRKLTIVLTELLFPVARDCPLITWWSPKDDEDINYVVIYRS